MDCRIERLNNSVIGSAKAVASSLRNFPAILSKPVAFEGFDSSRSLRTFSEDVGSNENDSERFMCWWYFRTSSSLCEDSLSFFTKSEARFEKHSLKISALVLSSKDGLPLSLKHILEGELFPEDNPRDFRFHKSLAFLTFSFSFLTIKDFFFFLIKYWT